MQCIIVRTSIPKIETDDLHVHIDLQSVAKREYENIQYSEVWKCMTFRVNVIVSSETYSLMRVMIKDVSIVKP